MSASTVLISPATPAAASRWPTLVLTEPIAQKPLLGGAGAKRLRQRRDLDRVAQRRGRAVRLDVADRLRRDAGHRLRQRDHRRLALDARGRVADLHEPSLLIAEPLITAWMWSPSASASLQPLQHDHAHAVAADRSLRLGVERPAVPVGRGYPAFLIDVAGLLRAADRDAAGQRHVALVSSRLWQARCTATSEVEQAVWTVTLGPRRFSLYETRVGRWSLSLPIDRLKRADRLDEVAIRVAGCSR